MESESNKRITLTKLLIVVAVLIVVFLIWAFLRSNSLTVVENIPITSLNKLAITEDQIYTVEGNLLTAHSYKGEVKWTKTVGLNEPILAATEDRIYLGEGRKLLILDNKGESVKELDLPLDCLAMKRSQDQIFIKSHVRQLLLKKDELATMVSNGSARMLGASLNETQEESIFTSLEFREGRLLSQIIWTDDQGGVLSKHSFFDEIVEFSDFFDEDSGVFATNEFIYLFQKGLVRKHVAVNFLKGIDISKNRLYLLDLDDLVVYDENLELKDRVPLKNDYKGIAAVKDGVVLYHENGYAVYSVGSVRDQESQREIQDVQVINDHIYLIHSDAISVIY